MEDKKPVVVVNLNDEQEFEKTCASWIAAGYRLDSSSCGFANSEAYDFASVYHAIFVLPVQANEVAVAVTNREITEEAKRLGTFHLWALATSVAEELTDDMLAELNAFSGTGFMGRVIKWRRFLARLESAASQQ